MSDATCIFLDECGYTGDDLINADQPVFVLASNNLQEDEASQLLKEHFGDVQSTELKHAVLSSRPKGQSRVVSFIRAISTGQRCATALWHKEYTLLTTIVDFWIETAMHRDGIDLYHRGGNIALSNLLYVSLNSLLPEQLLRGHLVRYQAMMRQRTRASYDAFWDGLWRLFDISDGLLQDTLVWMLGAERQLGFACLEDFPARPLNVTPSSLVAIATVWRDRTGKSIELIHDATRDLAKDRAFWEAALGPNQPAATVGHDRRQISFPLNVRAVRFDDSRSCAPLQVSDLVAGAVATVARNKIDSDYRSGYAKRLDEAGAMRTVVEVIWPDTAVTPDELGTLGPDAPGDVLEYLSKVLPDRPTDRPRCEGRVES